MTMLSRSGRSDPHGKLTHRLDIPVSEELHDAVTAMATIGGCTKAEWVRDLLSKAVWGELAMMRRLSGHAHMDQLDDGGRNIP